MPVTMVVLEGTDTVGEDSEERYVPPPHKVPGTFVGW